MSNSKKVKQASSDIEFSALHEMGIEKPTEICRYSLRQEDGEDILRIYYKRGKGSLRASSRKYRFGKTRRTIVTDSGRPEYTRSDEISDFLERAVAELDEIVRNSKDHKVMKEAFLDELDHLEKYVGTRIKELRVRAEQL